MNIKGMTIAALLASVALSLLSGGCASDKGVAAKVNGKRIYIKEVEEMIARYTAISKKLNPAYIDPTGMVLENMRRQFLDGLMDKNVILEKARELKIAVTDSELTAKIVDLKKTNEILDEASFNRYLQEQGITEELFRNNIRDIMLMEKTRDKFFADITIPDSMAQGYYKTHVASYAREKIQAAHILVKDSLKAEAAAKEAKAGKDFSSLTRKYSADAAAKTDGDLGVVGRGDMLSEIDQALFSLKKDEVAGPVRTKLGYHILKAFSDPKKEVRPFEEVKGEIVNALVLEMRQARLKSLRDNAKIKVIWDYKTL